MKKLFLAFSLAIISSVLVAAQDDYKKAEFFAGYSHGQVDGSTFRFGPSSDPRDTGPKKFHGFNVSGVYNVARYVGIKGDFSATYNKNDFSFPLGFFPAPPGIPLVVSGRNKNALYNFLGGVQFKDNSSETRVKPFGHLLVGGAHARTDSESEISGCSPPSCGVFPIGNPRGPNETGFAGAFGGGLDIALNDRFDIRAVQIDYNPVKLDSGTLHNVRIGVGIVFK